MINIKKEVKSFIKSGILVLVMLFGVIIAQAEWSNPRATPPDGNTDAPINIGDNTQMKKGSLILNTGTTINGINTQNINGLQVFGKSIFDTLRIVGGNPGQGKVLVSADNEGNAEWQNITSGTGTTKFIWKRSRGMIHGSGISSVFASSTQGSRPQAVFNVPMDSTNYVVVCSGDSSSGVVPLQVYPYIKTTKYFLIYGAHSAGEDQINDLECAVF